MKKFKKVLAAAIAVMTLSTAATVTGTVAWFTASNVVTAEGMNVTADTLDGITISNEAKSAWGKKATASHSGLKSDGETAEAFMPVTTEDTADWYYGLSDSIESSEAAGDLTKLTLATVSDGIAKIDMPDDALVDDKAAYLVNSFYLRTSSSEPIDAEHLYVNLVTVTGNTNSAELDKSFRVLVKYGDVIKVFAPLEDAADTKAPAIIKDTKNTILADNVTIPAKSTNSNADALEIQVFCYFEGEDSHCKSENIPEDGILSKLAISCKFGIKTIA